MRIKHYGHTHETIQQVRDCTTETLPPSIANPNRQERPPVTEAQRGLITNLLREKVHTYPAEFTADSIRTWQETRQVIDHLLAQPKKESAPGSVTSLGDKIPEGRYALKTDIWRFYEIDKPTEGKWAGYTFIVQLFGAPKKYRKEKLSASTRVVVMNAIAADPKRAQIDYGLESEHCGVCGSPLTNPRSIADGIGPVCKANRSKTLGWW